MDYHSAYDQKIELFYTWRRRCPDASWEHVIDALEAAGEMVIASDIKSDYSTPSSEEPKS